MGHFFLSLFLLTFFSSLTYAQQNYSADSALDCNSSDETGPSSAFLYTCNGQSRTCETFLIFKPQHSFNSVPTISALISSNPEVLARINNVTKLSEFPEDKEVIVPVYCSCLGQYYQANTTFHVRNGYSTYYIIATQTYEGLSTCASLKRANKHGEFDLELDEQLQVPLRCACPTASQIQGGTNYLLTYPIKSADSVADIAERFNVSSKSILDANSLEEYSAIYAQTTILLPLSTTPTSLETIIHKDPPSILPPLPSSPENGRSKSELYERVGIAAASSLLITIILAILFLLHRERRSKIPDSDSSREVKQGLQEDDLRIEIASVEHVLRIYGIKEVKKATENFSCKHRIKGSVYWGEFDGDILAVKKMTRDVSKEVNILKRINHFNLIKLHGVCENLGCFYLIFEYMKHGSLRELLSSNKYEDIGSWTKRIQIAVDIANGLYYLHSFTQPACVHKDIKSSNILLDGNLRAKIANFSLARAAERGTTNVAMTKYVEGTRGYMAPEYVEIGQVTPKIDVYAFGAVLLELITGKDVVFMQDGREILLSIVIFSIMQKQNAEAELLSFIDPALHGTCAGKLALRLTRVSLACLTREPARRPGMEEVVSFLLKIQADLERSESLNVNSVAAAVPSWCSSIGETDWRDEAISK